jgi:tRNA (cmo5U34)-methyltransferase
LLNINRPNLEAVALDVSPTMLKAARDHFANDPNVKVVEYDFNYPLPSNMGYFDAIVSSFTIHHLKHQCKRSLYEEIYGILNQTGVFCNLEHVPSPFIAYHMRFSESYWLYSANRRKI